MLGTVHEIWRYPVKSMAGEQLSSCKVTALGIPGDRGWALRDEASGEISGGKRIPSLMLCRARYRSEPIVGVIPQVDIVLPNGHQVASDDQDVNNLLSETFGRSVSLWPQQSPANKSHYRRAGIAPAMLSRVTRVPMFRKLLPRLLRMGKLEDDVREFFSREPGEPIPDLSQLPQEVLEYTSPPGTYFDAYPLNLLTTASLRTMAQYNPQAAWDVRRFRPNVLIETGADIDGLIEATWSGRTLRIGSARLKCEIPCARCGMTTQKQEGLPKDPSVLRSIVKDAEQNLGIYITVVEPGEIRKGDVVEFG